MIVPRSRQDEVIDLAVAALGSLAMGIPGSDDNFLGPLVSASQKRTVQDYIRLGIEERARPVAGGPDDPDGYDVGYYVRPTIFADVDNSIRIAQEEIFGPVLCIIPVDGDEEVIAAANERSVRAVGRGLGRHRRARRRRRPAAADRPGHGQRRPVLPGGHHSVATRHRATGGPRPPGSRNQFLETKAIQLPA